MIRITTLKTVKTLPHQLLQKCSVSGTAKGKGKIKEGQALKRQSKGGQRKNQEQDPSSSSKGTGNRKSQLEQLVDDCLQAKPPVRHLTPKQRAREAEREKMGLVSEARKLEIAEFKKNKNNVDNVRKIERIGPEGLDLVTLGVVDEDKIPKYELTAEDGKRLAKEYSRILMRKHRARQAAESLFLKCKNEAIVALPNGLREKALLPDMSPFPVNRFMATLTPPIEGYIEKINEAAKRQSSVKGKLR